MKNTKNIFSYAIKDLKKNKPIRGLYSDDFIDFNEESNKLGENIETKNYSSKIKSAVVKNNTPFYSSGPKVITLDHKTNSVKIVRTETNTHIILSSRNDEINITKNDKWKHDLFNEDSSYNYSVFIRNMSNLMTECKLKEIYSKFGAIMAVKAIILNFRWIEDVLRFITIRETMRLRLLMKQMEWECSVN
jgi:hypothetical protein